MLSLLFCYCWFWRSLRLWYYFD